MIKTNFISGLILGLTLFGKTLQADNTTTPEINVPSATGKVPTNEPPSAIQPAGTPRQGICQADEVKTSLGCEKAMGPNTGNKIRVPVISSTLNSDNTVSHSSLGVRPPQTDRNANDELQKPRKRKKYRRITGKDRPWKYVFLPGRKLRNGKSCKRNEVQGIKHRCIRRRHSKKSRTTTSHIR